MLKREFIESTEQLLESHLLSVEIEMLIFF